MAMTQFGEKTPSAVIFKHESHKLQHAFNVATGKTVYQGDPVTLGTDGTISPFASTDDSSSIIGYALTDSITPAYKNDRQSGPVEVTVVVNGYMIIQGIAGAAISAGPVKPNGTHGTGINASYMTYVADADGNNCIALNEADASELIFILVK